MNSAIAIGLEAAIQHIIILKAREHTDAGGASAYNPITMGQFIEWVPANIINALVIAKKLWPELPIHSSHADLICQMIIKGSIITVKPPDLSCLQSFNLPESGIVSIIPAINSPYRRIKHTCGKDGDPGAVAPLTGDCEACTPESCNSRDL